MSDAGWITATGGDASGSGTVVLRASPNTGAARSGTISVFGLVSGSFVLIQNVTATQNGLPTGPPGGNPTCGSVTDVTSKVRIDQSGLTAIDPFDRLMQQYIQITNISSTTLVGPLWLVFVGLPTTQVNVAGSTSLTTCFLANGDQIFLLPSVVLPPGLPGTGGLSYLFNKQQWYNSIIYSPRVLSGFNPPLK
jgi:hypothetical protein